jgi:glycosyltransferase 2 family protein
VPEAVSPEAPAPAPASRRWLWLALRLLGTAAGIAYVLTVADLREVGRAFGRTPFLALAACVALMLFNQVVGSFRWRFLMRAYGAERLPSIPRLFRAYLIGLFYNTFLPGGIGGDVVRGVITREAFGDRSTTAGVTVVLVERGFGLAGLLLLAGGMLFLFPLPALTGAALFGLAGVAGAAAAITFVALARRIAPRLPGPLRRIAERMPAITWPPGLALALALSLATQTIVALSGHVLLAAQAPHVSLTDSLVIVPVAAAAVYFPFTVGGLGAREAAFVALTTRVLHVDESAAVATSLLMWACQVAAASPGAVAQMLDRR